MGKTRAAGPRQGGSGNTRRADLVLRRLVEEFRSGRITETISKVDFLRDPRDNRPCMSWSLKNRVLMVGQGTFDARNVAQWNRVNRRVIARRSAIYIIRPLHAYSCASCAKGAARGARLRYARYTIHLGTESPWVFFHEISHAADSMVLARSGRALKGGQDPVQEAVAQLSACVLSEMYGMGSTRAHTRDYLRAQARGTGERELVRLALDVLDRVEGVLGLILSTAQGSGAAAESGQEDGHRGDGARAGKIRGH